MSDNRPVIMVTEASDPGPLQWLRQRAEVVEIRAGEPGFDEQLRRAQGLVVRTYTRVNDALLDRAPRLRVVGRGGVGLENIDVSACRRRGIEVVYTPDANTLAVGDFVFAYLLQLVRPMHYFRDKPLEVKEFARLRQAVRGRQLNEITLGILGMGRVGRRVGHIAASGFGMPVIYNDILDVAATLDFPAQSVSKEELYRRSEVLSIHVTMLPGNEKMVGREQLAMLPPGAIVINTSRGEVLDAAALAEAVRSGHISGAAVDVFDPEPPGPDLPLLGLDRVLLTPHLAARTNTALENMSWVVKDVWGVLNGEKARGPAPATP